MMSNYFDLGLMSFFLIIILLRDVFVNEILHLHLESYDRICTHVTIHMFYFDFILRATLLKGLNEILLITFEFLDRFCETLHKTFILYARSRTRTWKEDRIVRVVKDNSPKGKMRPGEPRKRWSDSYST
jgi:hypothetical protein